MMYCREALKYIALTVPLLCLVFTSSCEKAPKEKAEKPGSEISGEVKPAWNTEEERLLAEAVGKLDENRKEEARLKAGRERVEGKIQGLDAEKARLEGAMAEIEAARKKLEEEIAGIAAAMEGFEEERARLQAAKEELEAAIAMAAADVETAAIKEAEEAISPPPVAPEEEAPPAGLRKGKPEWVKEAAFSEGRVEIVWGPPPWEDGAASYKVYRDGSAVKSMTGTSFTEKGLKSGKKYCYQVAAYDAGGGESEMSDNSCVKTPALSTLEKPNGVIAIAPSEREVDLSWDAAGSGGGVMGYKIYLSGKLVSSTATPSFTQKDLNPETSYCYQIAAYDAEGNESEMSDSACAKTPALPEIEKPQGISTSAVSHNKIDLSWDEAEDEGVTSYNIYRDGVFLRTATTTSFTQEDLDPETSYCYEIATVDESGKESGKSESVCTQTLSGPDDMPPIEPTNFVAKAVSQSNIELSWNASTDNVRLEGYNIYHKGGLFISTQDTSISLSDLNPDTDYCFIVTAFDAASNESDNSGEACAKTHYEDVRRPAPPGSLTVISEVENNQIDLSWGVAEDDTGVTSYNLYKDGVFLKAMASTSAYDVVLDEEDESSCFSISATDTSGNESRRSKQVCVSKKSSGEEKTWGATLWSGGKNNYGQLGHGDTFDKSTLVMIDGLKGVLRVAAGVEHTIILKMDGTVWAWGRNDKGQLGDGTKTHRSNPVQIKGLADIVDIAAGWYHTLALASDGTVWAWGRNYYGQLGVGSKVDSIKAKRIKRLSKVIDIAAGWYHSVAVKSDGTVWVWGWNHKGQLGIPNLASKAIPIKVDRIKDVEIVSAGMEHTVVLKSDGTVWAWGRNNYGQVGLSTDSKYIKPVKLDGLDFIKEVTSGVYHSVALKSDGTVWAWGWKFSNPYKKTKAIPMLISGLTGVVDIAAGNKYTVALKGR
jgi:alpha-tubulin suppressor-like RCC1 family protein/chitodextrinase